MVSRKPKQPPSAPVNFRLKPAHFEQLKREAEERGLSHHAYARELLVAVLEDQGRQDILHALATLQADLDMKLDGFASSFAKALEAIILNVNKDADRDEVRAWVQAQFRQMG